jgi:predicted  nucleic acid-binding Zn-ribbon protein
MKKTTDLQQQIRDLKLKLIEVQTQIDSAPSKAVEDFKVLMGYMAPGYKTTDDLKTEAKTLKNQIVFLEGEVLAAEGTLKKGKPDGVSEHEKVKAEFEKVRKKKKISEGQRVDEILEEVAEKLGKTFEATKRALYYKPKK